MFSGRIQVYSKFPKISNPLLCPRHYQEGGVCVYVGVEGGGGGGGGGYILSGKTSCLHCNMNTLWNILMILGRNVDQDKMT